MTKRVKLTELVNKPSISEEGMSLDLFKTVSNFLKGLGYILSPNKEKTLAKYVSMDPKVQKLNKDISVLNKALESELDKMYKENPKFKKILDDLTKK